MPLSPSGAVALDEAPTPEDWQRFAEQLADALARLARVQLLALATGRVQ